MTTKIVLLYTGISFLLSRVVSPYSAPLNGYLLILIGLVLITMSIVTSTRSKIQPASQSTTATSGLTHENTQQNSQATTPASPQIVQDTSAPIAPLPQPQYQTSSQQPTSKKQGETIVGYDAKKGEYISLAQGDRRRGVYVIGKNGTGKTTFLVNLMLQDIEQGMGLCFLDPHGDAINDILRRLPKARETDVILLDVMDTKYPFGLNLYECSDNQDIELVTRTTEQVLHIFEKLWGAESKTPSWGPAMEDLLRNTALTLIANPGYTMDEIPLLLTDEEAREKIVGNVRSSQLRLFWQQFNKRKDKNEYTASTLNKVRAFLSSAIVEHIVGQSHTTVDFRQIMDESKILLVKLPSRYEDITSLVGSVLIGQLLNAALSRVDLPESKRRQFNLYADEYQRFATPDFATLLAEARKFAVATTIAHQFRDQLDQANRGATLNAANMVVFRVSGEDGEEIAKEFDATPPPAEQIGWKPILSPKRDVIEHLLKSGHSNPAYLDAAKILAGMTEVAGISIDRPNFRETDNVISIALQMRAGKQYRNNVELQQDLKVDLQRLNNLFFEVMRDRDANKPIPEDIMTTIIKAFEGYNIVKGSPDIIPLLCSADGAKLQQASRRIIAGTERDRKRAPIGENIVKAATSLRQLIQILAADPVLVDSGQHEPILDKPRTYADVQNQIATDLANLPAYTAKAKLGQTEVVLKTISLEAGIPDDLLQERTTTILTNTRAKYCKPRQEVEDEITTRQERLLQPVKKMSRSNQEEVI